MIDWDNIKHFDRAEFDSADLFKSGNNMQPEFIYKLDVARGFSNSPFTINSGYRTPEHNKKVGGVPGSSHVTGWAADISATDGSKRFEIINALLLAGFNRIGVAKTFIHVDCQPDKPQNVIWTY